MNHPWLSGVHVIGRPWITPTQGSHQSGAETWRKPSLCGQECRVNPERLPPAAPHPNHSLASRTGHCLRDNIGISRDQQKVELPWVLVQAHSSKLVYLNQMKEIQGPYRLPLVGLATTGNLLFFYKRDVSIKVLKKFGFEAIEQWLSNLLVSQTPSVCSRNSWHLDAFGNDDGTCHHLPPPLTLSTPHGKSPSWFGCLFFPCTFFTLTYIVMEPKKLCDWGVCVSRGRERKSWEASETQMDRKTESLD